MSRPMEGAMSMKQVQEYREVSDAVIFAVADAEDVSPLELTPLTHAIDPDALNNFVGSLQEKQTNCNGYIEFEYRDHCITVRSDGDISID